MSLREVAEIKHLIEAVANKHIRSIAHVQQIILKNDNMTDICIF
jgi:hypothetical protein